MLAARPERANDDGAVALGAESVRREGEHLTRDSPRLDPALAIRAGLGHVVLYGISHIFAIKYSLDEIHPSLRSLQVAFKSCTIAYGDV